MILWGAVKTIIVADLVMSTDNVIAIAGAAHGSLGLLKFGLAVSIPLIVWSSQLMLKLMDRFPLIITGGAASMIATDVVFSPWLETHVLQADNALAAAGAILVAAVGYEIARRMNNWKTMTELTIDTKEKPCCRGHRALCGRAGLPSDWDGITGFWIDWWLVPWLHRHPGVASIDSAGTRSALSRQGTLQPVHAKKI